MFKLMLISDSLQLTHRARKRSRWLVTISTSLGCRWVPAAGWPFGVPAVSVSGTPSAAAPGWSVTWPSGLTAMLTELHDTQAYQPNEFTE